jgi:two-component system, sensor histidine kinase RegB
VHEQSVHDMHAMHGMSADMHAMHTADGGFSAHLQGMFGAFVLAAVLIAWFVSRVTRALAEERRRAERASRLVGLTTLAAGAAHELATPLASIKLAARELERALEGRPELAHALEDARLVRHEVERSRAVLDRLAADAGEVSGEAPVEVSAESLLSQARELTGVRAERIVISDSASGSVCAPPNALDASTERVTLGARFDGSRVVFEVEDQGSGIDPTIAARVGEPFFTTKPAGKGMGLGVFLVRSLAERLGGGLEYRRRVAGGTVAVLSVRR